MKWPVSLLCALEYIDHFATSCSYQVLLDKVSHRGLNSGKLHASSPVYVRFGAKGIAQLHAASDSRRI
jgi:hypothetical protein